MKQLLVISLLVLGLMAGSVMGGCSNCKEKDGKECFKDECRCKVDYFTSKATGKCTRTCDSLTTDYIKYPKHMLEQGQSFRLDNMPDAEADETTCMEKCTKKARCAGFSVKRNELTGRGKCFYFDSSAGENNPQQWKDHKGRWLYYARKCQ